MADIGQDIRTYLLADTAVSNLVGSRITPDVLPQGETMPAIVVTVVSSTPAQQLHTTPSSFASSRIQIDCYDDGRPGANALAEKVRLRLQNKRGDIGDSRVSTIALDGGTEYDYDAAAAGTQQVRYVATQDYQVHHQTATS